MINQTLQIHDMHCTMCCITIDGVLEDLPGVHAAHTSFGRRRAEVTYDPAHLSVQTIVAVLREAGYKATVVT